MKVHLFKKANNILFKFIDSLWYKNNILAYFLWPISVIFKLMTYVRRFFLQKFCQKKFSLPIIVVGNISVGGVGKTPLVIAIADKFTQDGFKVGIVSRGYKSSLSHVPYLVKKSDKASLVGDEPLLLAMRTGCSVVIDPDRCRAVDYLIEYCKPDIIISDDGLQHYKMGREVEIAVIDASRGCGNGFCLPAGPLRESSNRLEQVDFIIINGEKDNYNFSNAYKMVLEPEELRAGITGEPIKNLNSKALAIAGIGNPDRFFKTLSTLGLETENQGYPDHYMFRQEDFIGVSKPIIMTEKDFVKCKDFADDRMYFLAVSAIISDEFWDRLKIKVANFSGEDESGWCF